MIRGSRAPLTVPKPLMLFTVPSAFRYRLVGVGLVKRREVQGAVDAAELGVIEGVERVDAELEVQPASVMLNSFCSDMSQLLMPGPVR